MKKSFFSFLDFIAPAGILQQVSQGSIKNSPVLLILLLLILTCVIIWTSYYYWQIKRSKASREQYRIKSAKLIKNGRKYTKKEQEMQN